MEPGLQPGNWNLLKKWWQTNENKRMQQLQGGPGGVTWEAGLKHKASSLGTYVYGQDRRWLELPSGTEIESKSFLDPVLLSWDFHIYICRYVVIFKLWVDIIIVSIFLSNYIEVISLLQFRLEFESISCYLSRFDVDVLEVGFWT